MLEPNPHSEPNDGRLSPAVSGDLGVSLVHDWRTNFEPEKSSARATGQNLDQIEVRQVCEGTDVHLLLGLLLAQ